jgi:hypothetical protein
MVLMRREKIGDEFMRRAEVAGALWRMVLEILGANGCPVVRMDVIGMVDYSSNDLISRSPHQHGSYPEVSWQTRYQRWTCLHSRTDSFEWYCFSSPHCKHCRRMNAGSRSFYDKTWASGGVIEGQ